MKIKTGSGDVLDLASVRSRARTKLEMWSYYIAQEGQLVHRDLEAVLDALEAACRREDAIRAELAQMGHQNSGLILQRIELILGSEDVIRESCHG